MTSSCGHDDLLPLGYIDGINWHWQTEGHCSWYCSPEHIWGITIAQKIYCFFYSYFIKWSQYPTIKVSVITSVFKLVELSNVLHINTCSIRGGTPGWWLNGLLVRRLKGIRSGSSYGPEQRNPTLNRAITWDNSSLSVNVPIVHDPHYFPGCAAIPLDTLAP